MTSASALPYRQELAGGRDGRSPALPTKEVERIIRLGPPSEAGSALFLPGDWMAKSTRICDRSTTRCTTWSNCEGAEALEKGSVEVAPLRSCAVHAQQQFIILDEAQNTTPEQMKMVLTRIGFGSKAVITGDRTQADVPVDAAVSKASNHCSTASKASHSCISAAAMSCAIASCRTLSMPTPASTRQRLPRRRHAADVAAVPSHDDGAAGSALGRGR